MQFSEVSIVTPTALYVQMLEAENAPVKKQVRIKRSDIDRDDISAKCGRWAVTSRTAGRRGAPFVFLPCAGVSGGRCYARSN